MNARLHHVLIPAGALTGVASLTFDNGVEKLAVRADAALEELLEAQFGDPTPVVWAADHKVHVEYPLGARLLRRMQANSIRLNPSLAWSIDVYGGAAHLDLNLADIALHSLSFHAGAAHSRITLGHPKGEWTIRLRSVKGLTVRRPPDTPMRVEIAGAAVGITLDGSKYSAAAGVVRQSPGFDTAAHRYVVLISGGADTITIRTNSP